jgi:hypothetical protein
MVVLRQGKMRRRGWRRVMKSSPAAAKQQADLAGLLRKRRGRKSWKMMLSCSCCWQIQQGAAQASRQ